MGEAGGELRNGIRRGWNVKKREDSQRTVELVTE